MSSSGVPTIAEKLAAAFAGRLVIGHAEAARLLDMDRKTLIREGENGFIRVRRKGRRRAYAEEDLAEYLSRSRLRPSTDRDEKTARMNRASGTSMPKSKSTAGPIDFTAALAKQRRLARLHPRKPKDSDDVT